MKKTLDLSSLDCLRKYSEKHQDPIEKEIHKELDFQIKFDYIKKSLFILALQISSTILLAINLLYEPSLIIFIQNSSFLLASMTVLASLICCLIFFKKEIARQVPINYILLFFFTICEAYITTYYLSQIEDKNLILISLGITIGITIVISIYVMFSKNNFNIENGIMYSLISYFTILSFLMMNIGTIHHKINLIYNFFGLMFYAYALLNDFERLFKKNNFECDDYITEAMLFYIHILNLFNKVLRIFVSRKGK